MRDYIKRNTKEKLKSYDAKRKIIRILDFWHDTQSYEHTRKERNQTFIKRSNKKRIQEYLMQIPNRQSNNKDGFNYIGIEIEPSTVKYNKNGNVCNLTNTSH